MPHVVVVGIRAGEGLGGAGIHLEGNGLGLGTRVVCAAHGDFLAEVVLDLDAHGGGAGHAEVARHAGVGEVELTTLAEETTDGLSGRALQRWPLALLVACRAGVRAEVTLTAAVVSGAI